MKSQRPRGQRASDRQGSGERKQRPGAKPARPAQGKSPRPARDERARPAQDKRARPAQDKRARPAQNERARPAQNERARPAQDERARPAQDKRARPAQNERARPARDERARPAQEKRARPAQDKRARPAWSQDATSPRTSVRKEARAAYAEHRKRGGKPGAFARAQERAGTFERDADPSHGLREGKPKTVSGELDKARLERVPYPKIPDALSQLKGEPHPGQWLFTTREGSEQDLVDELMLLKVIDPAPRVLSPGLVLAPKVPKRDKRPVDLTFARQGFEILIHVRADDLAQLTARVERSLRNKLANASQYALHVWVADSALTNPLSGLADALEAQLAERLAQSLPNAKRVDDASLRRLGSIPFAQVCLLDTAQAAAGVTHSNAAPSLARGGRTRVRVTGDVPSRAARKLEEALAWLGVEPGPGDVCVDLGAAPGGWTYVLAERRARVIAVDPAKLRPDILAKKGVRHLQESAFTYAPDEPIDWLFCDMAWRPLEAAALLAKWGRKRWARMIVANIKLPMKKKAEILARVRAILETEGEWKGLRFKQLYHDRDEITLTAHRA